MVTARGCTVVVTLWRGRAEQRAQAAELATLRTLLDERLGEVLAGRAGSVATVARLPVTIAARALIADVGASLPMLAVRDGQVVTPTPSILVRPDPSMPRRRTQHRALMSLSGWGNLYMGIVRVGVDAWPLAAEVLHPDWVAPDIDPTYFLRVTGWHYMGTPVDLVHVPLWELDLQPIARSPLAEAQAAFDDLALMWGFAAQYWTEGGKPPYALKYASRMDGPQAASYLEQWVAARRARRPGLLTGGWDIADLSMPNAADALLLDGLAYIDQCVGRIFGLTPTLLNIRAETGSLTYSNARDEVTRWLSLSLYPTWLARLEDCYSDMLPRGQQAVIDGSGVGQLGMFRAGLDEGASSSPPPPPPPPPAPAPDSPTPAQAVTRA